MWQEGDEAPFDCAFDPKGDEIQKLSVIQNLPSLLAADTQSCMSRVVPKMQQSLANASTEFHIAASSTFKIILEQKLVSYSVFSQTFLQSILNSLESRDPVVCHAWLETLLDVIELLPIEVIRVQILPMTISKGQLSQPIYSRITCSRLLGKICTRFDSNLIQKEVLPTVHSLCQDVNSEVRASICLQLRFVAEGLGAESVKPALLPSLVELASDEESHVRFASVQTIVNLLPHLQEDTIKSTIAPLIKKLCENATKSDDNVICMIAQEFGKLTLGLEKCLTPVEKGWFLKYFQRLAQMGIPSMKKEAKPDLPFASVNPAENERYVECRRLCAYNLPAMFVFATPLGEDVDALLATFNSLACDPYYIVRRTVACGLHEIAKVLGPKNTRIKNELVKLLKDDSEEVLQGLVPHIAMTLECLSRSQTIGTERVDSTLMEIGRALLKCEAEIARTTNWRLVSLMHGQLEILPKCFPSDFIYSYFVPMSFSRIMHGRPIPVRLAAGRLYLVFLRYNNKAVQRSDLRGKIYSELANSPDCHVRMIFVRMMIEAIAIFSSVYFKEHFFTALLALAEDRVPNIRLKVVQLLPIMKSQLSIPTDKKLLASFEACLRHLNNSEKDRDVKYVLGIVIQKLDETEVKYEGQGVTSKMAKHDVEDLRKLEEEKKLLGQTAGKSQTGVKKNTVPLATRPKPSEGATKSLPQPIPKGEHLLDSVELYNESKASPSIKPSKSTTVGTYFTDVTTTSRQADVLKTSSMPEIPVTLSDDEFFVDAGIRIPAQLSSSQSASKIPNLQDFIFGKRRMAAANVDRSRRGSMSFEKGKPKRHSSVEYEDCMKQRTNEQSKTLRTSIDYEEGLRRRSMMKENLDDQQLSKVDSRFKRYSAPHGRTRFGFDLSQVRSTDDKLKRNPLVPEKDKPKIVHNKCPIDRTKRHSANYSLKPLDAKDMKQKMKRHSLEVTDYVPNERIGRALRRYSTLDVNHNQGISKIPLRSSVLSGSRTAPATRSSSPVRWGHQLRFDAGSREDVIQGSASERHLTRFSSSDEEVDKLCRMLLHSQTAPNSRTGSPRTRDSRLPIRLLRKKL